MTKNKKAVIEINNVFKSFQTTTQEIEIIKGISMNVYEGEFIIIFGPSGCGKSTMLNMALGLERPTKGKINFMGEDFYRGDEDLCSSIRKKHIGIVYQQSNWVKALNVIENVGFPLMITGVMPEERIQKATEALEIVGMADKVGQIPTELSSGQQQRIALARAIVANPNIIVADEPTGNLDSVASECVMELFKEFNEEGKTVIMVTHDLEYLKYATRVINIVDGKLAGEYESHDEKLKEYMVSKRGTNPNPIETNIQNGKHSSINGKHNGETNHNQTQDKPEMVAGEKVCQIKVESLDDENQATQTKKDNDGITQIEDL